MDNETLKKKVILFNISNIAILTGDNPYKKRKDYLIEFWEKYEPEDYQKYKNLTKFNKYTDTELIQIIAKKNNIQINQDLNKCLLSADTNQLNDTKKKLEDDIVKNSNINASEKKEILKSINNVTNTNFGTRNETDVLKIYESMKNCSVLKDNIYRKKKIYDDSKAVLYIGGKIDGISSEDNTIIEIKNRVSRLFYTLRDYEKVQVMCYIYLFNYVNAHLVEAHKKKDKTDINIIEVMYDNDYMVNILNKITRFYGFFEIFMENEHAKIQLLNMSDSDPDINF